MKKIITLIISIMLIVFTILSFVYVSRNKNGEIKHDNWFYESLNLNSLNHCSKNTICIIDSGCNLIGFDDSNIISKYNVFDESENIEDTLGHGTAMLSLLIGYDDHNISIKGINPQCNVIVIKAVNDDGYASAEDVSKAIEYALDFDVDIISISLGSYRYSNVLENSINKAIKRGCYIIGSIGDDSKAKALYPAAFNGVIPVCAQSKHGEKYIYSNYCENSVLCPGVSIKVCTLDKINRQWIIEQNSGSSIATIIFASVLSCFDLDNYSLNLNYLYECKENNSFFDVKKMMVIKSAY